MRKSVDRAGCECERRHLILCVLMCRGSQRLGSGGINDVGVFEVWSRDLERVKRVKGGCLIGSKP